MLWECHPVWHCHPVFAPYILYTAQAVCAGGLLGGMGLIEPPCLIDGMTPLMLCCQRIIHTEHLWFLLEDPAHLSARLPVLDAPMYQTRSCTHPQRNLVGFGVWQHDPQYRLQTSTSCAIWQNCPPAYHSKPRIGEPDVHSATTFAHASPIYVTVMSLVNLAFWAA